MYVNIRNYANIKVKQNFKSNCQDAVYIGKGFCIEMKIHIYLIIMLFCDEFSSIHSITWKGPRTKGLFCYFRLYDNDLLNLRTFLIFLQADYC